jgi:hypothetical protein
MQVFNQYSVVWIGALLVIIMGYFLLRRKLKWFQVLAFGILLLGLGSMWVLLHPRQTDRINSAAQVEASIGQGIPVLLELQSPY